ncbi:MAG: ATP-dependent DNA helicase RecG [Moraxellaceae bacterium]|nr:ATP-dependent DNA helicase RecG [Moraxellaceae bacterium]
MSQHLAHTSIQQLKGVGVSLADKLARLGLTNLQELLFHLPRDYEDRSHITLIGDARTGASVLLEGEVLSCEVAKGKRQSLAVRLGDETGHIMLRFYHFYPQQKDHFKRGTYLRVFGEIRLGASGKEIYHPEYKAVRANEPLPDAKLTAIYPTTDGVTQPRLRQLINDALVFATPQSLPELLPSFVNSRYDLLQALHMVHNPPNNANRELLLMRMHPAQQRLAFEELTAHQVSLAQRRQHVQILNAPVLDKQCPLAERLLAQLPFALTNAQQRVWREIADDLTLNKPMLRLVQGDVGAGKTVVAALAACHAVAGQWQVGLMAPTEILAEQHYINFSTWFNTLGFKVAWLSGKQGTKERNASLAMIANGEAQVIVGTHALFQDSVQFARLGLVIIDEQHRFGVDQRLALRQKGEQWGMCPHQLIMTATPIPRTLAMSAYGDLDTSVIDELPPNRTPVTTVALPNTRRADVIERVRANCQTGKQAYWVCTLIEESEQLEAQAAQAIYESLAQELPELRLGLVHGKLKASEKQAIMAEFKQGNLDLLVATTVIEVGVDVPNSSLMIIENAERLGLAQLHQLRGRVGRGSTVSYCVLLYQSPLSQSGQERLAIMRSTTDGFVIAEKDLELRGPGEVLGTRQTGMVEFKVADLSRDHKMLKTAQQVAKTMQKDNPQQAQALVQRWLPNAPKYVAV